MDVLVRGGDEARERRVRLMWLAQKFRMKLARDGVKKIARLDKLNQFAIRRKPLKTKLGFIKFAPAVGVVELFAVTVTFIDDKRAVLNSARDASTQAK